MPSNMMNFIQSIITGGNPEQAVLNMLAEKSNNPTMANFLSMAQRGNGQGIEQLARQMFQQRGLDFDKEFNSFRQKLRL